MKNDSIIKRWNFVMNSVGLEHLTLDSTGEVLSKPDYYAVPHEGVTAYWMWKEARYWLDSYYDEDCCRCYERYEGPEYYKIWVSETGKLKRLISALQKIEPQTVVYPLSR